MSFGVHISAQAQPGLETAATSAESVSAQVVISPEILSQAIVDGNLEEVIAEALGENPGPDQINALQGALDVLAVNAPADAAVAARAVVARAQVLAIDHPQAAVDVARSATRVLTYPGVADTDPNGVGQALADVVGVVTLAMRSAESQGVTLTGTEIAEQAVQFAQTNDAVSAAVPEFNERVAEAEELANIQADLAGVMPAAGGDEAGLGGDTGPGEAAELVSTLASSVGEGGGGGGSIISPAAR
ncbi:hypothetical protein [Halochromatium roseum]|uniref:hypothetical protein n=1 Tax=Halochromatium roseum TaxID=391920 RepID=UPI001914A106|nr:hypothetical protein [Halochromatium roseum]